MTQPIDLRPDAKAQPPAQPTLRSRRLYMYPCHLEPCRCTARWSGVSVAALSPKFQARGSGGSIEAASVLIEVCRVDAQAKLCVHVSSCVYEWGSPPEPRLHSLCALYRACNRT